MRDIEEVTSLCTHDENDEIWMNITSSNGISNGNYIVTIYRYKLCRIDVM